MGVNEDHRKTKETRKRRELFKCFTASLYLFFGKTSNPQAPFDDPLHGLEPILCAGVDQAEQAFDNPGCCAITLEIDQKTTVITACLSRLLGIIGKIVDI